MPGIVKSGLKKLRPMIWHAFVFDYFRKLDPLITDFSLDRKFSVDPVSSSNITRRFKSYRNGSSPRRIAQYHQHVFVDPVDKAEQFGFKDSIKIYESPYWDLLGFDDLTPSFNKRLMKRLEEAYKIDIHSLIENKQHKIIKNFQDKTRSFGIANVFSDKEPDFRGPIVDIQPTWILPSNKSLLVPNYKLPKNIFILDKLAIAGVIYRQSSFAMRYEQQMLSRHDFQIYLELFINLEPIRGRIGDLFSFFAKARILEGLTEVK